MRVIQWLRANSYISILVLLGLFFIVVYSWFYYGLGPHFSSPDEVSNYYFTSLYSEAGALSYHESLSDIGSGLVRPRSTVAVGENIASGSFLGLIVVYGFIAKIFGSSVILFLTPIISVLGVIFFYKLVNIIFSSRIAFISALLMFVLPPYWYYSSRGMFHHILFLTLFIIGLYYLIRILKKESSKRLIMLQLIVSGICIGLALFARTSEIFWVALLLIAILFILRKRIRWTGIVIFLVSLGVIVSGFLFINASVYGSVVASGYSAESVDTSSIQTVTVSIAKKIAQLIFPFGINFQKIGPVVVNYLFLIFPWFSLLFILGILLMIRGYSSKLPEMARRWFPSSNEFNITQHCFFWLYCACSIWLIIYYGSFTFTEHIDQSEIILGSSFLRYWLPIFVFGLPLCVKAIMYISNLVRRKTLRTFIISCVAGLFVFLSVNSVLLDPLQGLAQLKKNNSTNKDRSVIILQETEEDAVIIAGHADKVFFPIRKVIAIAPSEIARGGFVTKSLLSDDIPLYYIFNPLDSTADETKRIFDDYEIGMKEMHQFMGSNEVLYKLYLR